MRRPIRAHTLTEVNACVRLLPTVLLCFDIFLQTAAINISNPMVDRIMEDDSVEGVIMTNKEGILSFILKNLLNMHTYIYIQASFSVRVSRDDRVIC